MNRITKKNLKIKVIANPSAGGGISHEYIPGIRKRLEQQFSHIEFSLTNGPGDATRLSREAVEHGFHRIIAVGGDGTANEVAMGLIGSGVIMGVIPTGKNNDFFRMLSGDVSLENAYYLISKGEIESIDTGTVNDRIFINAVGVGINAVLAGHNRKSSDSSSWLPGKLGLTMKVISEYNFPEINLNIDNISFKDCYAAIAVGLGTYSANGLKLTPYANPVDGLLDICLIKKKSRFKLLSDFHKAKNGKHSGGSRAILYRCRQAFISANVPLPFHIDGENYDITNKGAIIKVNPKSLKVLRDRKIIHRLK